MSRLRPLQLILVTLCVFSLPAASGGDPTFMRGDCNGDLVAGVVSDPATLLSWAFLGLDEPPCLAACDANADGGLDVSDAIYWLNFQVLGGPAPEPPFPNCGPTSLSSDLALGCANPSCDEE